MRTKYSYMTVEELLRFANFYKETLPEIGVELLYRLEQLTLPSDDRLDH